MVTNIFTNGTVADADEVNQNFIDLTRKNYADNTGGSIFNSSTETDLASITITQNDLNATADLVVTANLKYFNNQNVLNTGTFRLYIGGILQKTRTLSSVSIFDPDGSLSYLKTNIDSTSGDIIVKITGQNNDIDPGRGSEVYELIVVGSNN